MTTVDSAYLAPSNAGLRLSDDERGAAGDEPLPPDGPARPRNRAAMLTALSPFVAVALLVLTGAMVGRTYAWLWFLLVPVTAIAVYVGRPGPR
jgi:hypothetical protein